MDDRTATDRRGRILVVDDDVDMLHALRETLEHEGYGVDVATNGKEALDRARGDAPDLILLDVMMPEMDGWQFRKLQKADPRIANIPVVVITAGHTAPWDVDAIVPKPLTLEKLRWALRMARR